MSYSGVVTEGAISRPCDHLHGSIVEALDCAASRVMHAGSTTTVIGADAHPDGLPRNRELNGAEREELATLIASGHGRG